MDETITSSFDIPYYFKALTGCALLLWCTGYMLYHSLLNNFLYPVQAYVITLILLGLCWVFYHFFSKSWKRITVTATEIVVDDVVFKKKIIIPFTDITRIGTYRSPGTTGRFGGGGVFAQDFVIEYKNDQSVAINEGWYENYNKLTKTIYYHKYGPGHGRERYLARHGVQS